MKKKEQTADPRQYPWKAPYLQNYDAESDAGLIWVFTRCAPFECRVCGAQHEFYTADLSDHLYIVKPCLPLAWVVMEGRFDADKNVRVDESGIDAYIMVDPVIKRDFDAEPHRMK